MNPQPSRATRAQRGITLLAALGLAFAFACNQSEAAPQQRQTAAPEKAGQDDGARGPAAGPKVETETYLIEMKLAGACKAGSECIAEVTLTAKDKYHTNAQYPYKFKLADPAPEGVTFPKPILQRADGKWEEKLGSFRVPFVIAKPGKAKIGGTFSLSVCSEANCIMDKQPLEIEAEAK